MFLRGGCVADSKSPPLYLLALAEEIRHRLQETHRELSSVIDQLRGSSETDDGADTNAVSPSHIGMSISFSVSASQWCSLSKHSAVRTCPPDQSLICTFRGSADDAHWPNSRGARRHACVGTPTHRYVENICSCCAEPVGSCLWFVLTNRPMGHRLLSTDTLEQRLDTLERSKQAAPGLSGY
jgi:hypothetical protein